MIVAKEITEWTESPNTPNHTYLLSDKKAKVYAYWNVVDGSFHVMSTKGANFSASRRRFDIIERNVQSIDEINTKDPFSKSRR
jgi:hypothetical protein